MACRRAGVPACGCADVRMCGCADVRMCGCAGVQVSRCPGVQVSRSERGRVVAKPVAELVLALHGEPKPVVESERWVDFQHAELDRQLLFARLLLQMPDDLSAVPAVPLLWLDQQ